MSRIFKINTAILICTAFIFRLLLVNIGIFSSVNSPQNNIFLKSDLSYLKKRDEIEIVKKSAARQYSAYEICEEDFDDEDDLSKADTFILIQVLYSFFEKSLISFKPNALFDTLHNKLSSKKYLAISVLRI